MTNIFILNNLNGKDGTSRLSKDINDYLIYKKLDNIIFTNTINKFNFDKDSLKSNPFSKFNFFLLLYDLIVILIFLKKNKNKKIRNIICLTENYSLLGFIISILYNAKNFICCYGTYAQRLSIKNKLYNHVFNKSIILPSSNYTQKSLFTNNLKSKSFVLKLFVSNSFLDFAKSNKNFILKKKQFTFVGGGSFYKRRKGLQFIMEILKNENFRKLGLKFLIIGNKNSYNNVTYNDKQNNELEFNFNSFKKELNKIYPNNQFCGQLSDYELLTLYQSSYFNILLADHNYDEYDGYGLIHSEANSAKTYSIGSLKSGSSDAIYYGRSFMPDQTDNIVKYIEEINQYPIIENFSFDKIRTVDNYFFDLNNFLNTNY